MNETSSRTPPEADAPSLLEAAAQMLEASGEYRILRRLKDFESRDFDRSVGLRTGIALDVETTGLDVRDCAVIQISMIKFAYSLAGRVAGVIGRFEALQDPGRDIPPEVTALTGIDDALVRGMSIDGERLAAFVGDAATLVVAHNASFDRPICERAWPVFASKPWACSATEIDWRGLGFGSARLGALATEMGFFFGAHRAEQDTLALLHILAASPPGQEDTALGILLAKARRPSVRVWATDAPFASKNVLKARGYKWNPGGEGTPRAWTRDLFPDALDAEVAFLSEGVYRRPIVPPIQDLTAFNRFSLRQPFRTGAGSAVSTREYARL